MPSGQRALHDAVGEGHVGRVVEAILGALEELLREVAAPVDGTSTAAVALGPASV